MRTESCFFTEHLNIDMNQVHPADMDDKELGSVRKYVEITRHIQEIDNLFHVFRFNLKSILHYYVLLYSDKIERKIAYDHETSDCVAINALTINFISSGKTLMESIENFLKINDGELYEEFKKNYLSKEYDGNFQYRFLLRLRDYAQHGHLPVSMNFDNKYCFDLNHILLTPHFNHNPTIKNEMEDIKDKIYEQFSDYPYIVLTRSLAEFNICITRNYLEFLKKIRKLLHDSVDDIKSLLEKRPKIINKSSDGFDGYVFYEITDGTLHAFNTKDNPQKMLSQYKNFVSKVLKEEQAELDKMNASFVYN